MKSSGVKEAEVRAIKGGYQLYNVTRMDYEKATGWWVRIIKNRVQYSKLFSDGCFDTPYESLMAAVKYRDDLLDNLYVTYTKYKKTRRTRQKMIIDKIPGITHNIRLKHNKYIEECWVASWNEEGKQKKKIFSVKKHGAVNALKLAKAYRDRKISEFYSHEAKDKAQDAENVRQAA